MEVLNVIIVVAVLTLVYGVMTFAAFFTVFVVLDDYLSKWLSKLRKKTRH